jgi:phospholipase C
MSTTPTIENIIVVMLENRSYDNMLGGLYLNSNAAPYNTAPAGQTELKGLAVNGNPGNFSNPYPSSNSQPPIPIGNQTTPTQIGGTGTEYPATAIPVIDPGEPFADMAWQITGSEQSTNPYVSWPPSSTENLMQGFIADYASQHGLCVTPPAENYPDVMNYFTPAQVPVTAWLANKFGVCDQWFASVPTHTFTNRVFAHCAAPGLYYSSSDPKDNHSFLDDQQYLENQWNVPSIFYMLDAAYPDSASTPNWKVYFHDYCISMLTVPYVMDAAITNGNANGNVATYDNTDWGSETPRPITWIFPREQTALKNVATTFLEDLQNGTLAKYSFIEPRYSTGRTYSPNPSDVQSITPNSFPPNSNHPGASAYPGAAIPSNPVSATNPPTDVANGEAFLAQIYNALNQSTYWGKTLLIITYDEHGGCYDHVPPPVFTPSTNAAGSSTDLGATIETTVPPGSTSPTSTTPSIDIPSGSDLIYACAEDFRYNVYGCRVPTIIVSPFIKPGSQISPKSDLNNPFDHASIIRTIWDIFFTNGKPTNPPTVSSLTNRDAAAPSLYDSLDFTINNNPGQCEAD